MINCRSGHKKHDTLLVDINLSGQSKVWDFPNIISKYAMRFKMRIYDAQKYKNIKNYCTGKDDTSNSIFLHGIWEGFETALVLDILSRGNERDLVIDIGAHLGWYTIISALKGYDVIAIDGDAENVKNLRHNASINKVDGRVHATYLWIDNNTNLMFEDIKAHFYKCDIEGMEDEAVRAASPLFINGNVKYAMLEISPILNKRHSQLVKLITSFGYEAYQIPSKGFEYIEEYSEAPLATLVKYCHVSKENIENYVSKLRQENFLFIKSV